MTTIKDIGNTEKRASFILINKEFFIVLPPFTKLLSIIAKVDTSFNKKYQTRIYLYVNIEKLKVIS